MLTSPKVEMRLRVRNAWGTLVKVTLGAGECSPREDKEAPGVQDGREGRTENRQQSTDWAGFHKFITAVPSGSPFFSKDVRYTLGSPSASSSQVPALPRMQRPSFFFLWLQQFGFRRAWPLSWLSLGRQLLSCHPCSVLAVSCFLRWLYSSSALLHLVGCFNLQQKQKEAMMTVTY